MFDSKSDVYSIPRLHTRNELSGAPEERKFGAYIAAVCGQSTRN